MTLFKGVLICFLKICIENAYLPVLIPYWLSITEKINMYSGRPGGGGGGGGGEG